MQTSVSFDELMKENEITQHQIENGDEREFPFVMKWNEIREKFLRPYFEKKTNTSPIVTTMNSVFTHCKDTAMNKIPLDLIKLIGQYAEEHRAPLFYLDDTRRPKNGRGDPYTKVYPIEMKTGLMVIDSNTCWDKSILIRLSMAGKWLEPYNKRLIRSAHLSPNSTDGRFVSTFYFTPGGYWGGCTSQWENEDNAILSVLQGIHEQKETGKWNDFHHIPCKNCVIGCDNYKTVLKTLLEIVFNSPVHSDSDVYIADTFEQIPGRSSRPHTHVCFDAECKRKCRAYNLKLYGFSDLDEKYEIRLQTFDDDVLRSARTIKGVKENEEQPTVLFQTTSLRRVQTEIVVSRRKRLNGRTRARIARRRR